MSANNPLKKNENLMTHVGNGCTLVWNVNKGTGTFKVPDYTCRINLKVTTLKDTTEIEMNPYNKISNHKEWCTENYPDTTLQRLMCKVMHDN